MLDDFGDARVALSLGVGPEVSWDADVAALGLRVLQFDHTVEGPPQANDRFVFHRTRVVGTPRAATDVTLADIMRRDELAADHDVIVKIDVEGFEWEILAGTATGELARIRQIAIEFHHMRQFIEPSWRRTALAALANLHRTHACIHIHGNNWSPFTVIGGIPFPDVFEATFRSAQRPCAQPFGGDIPDHARPSMQSKSARPVSRTVGTTTTRQRKCQSETTIRRKVISL